MGIKSFARGTLVAAGLAFCLAIAQAEAGPMPGVGTWETTLLGRDINGNAVDGSSVGAVFLYDTTLDITWLRDAGASGAMDWEAGLAWADNLNLGGFTDWRLPAPGSCTGFNCTDGELGHLWYVSLGNPAYAGEVFMVNTGAFQNLGMRYQNIWTSAANAALPAEAWSFDSYIGYLQSMSKTDTLSVMPVRAGDVLAVPEPQTAVLLFAGLTGLCVLDLAARARKRERRRANRASAEVAS